MELMQVMNRLTWALLSTSAVCTDRQPAQRSCCVQASVSFAMSACKQMSPNRFLNIVLFLLPGARVNAGRGSDSPLHAAVRKDCAEQVSLLLEFGADVNLRDENNQRPLELAPPGGKTHQLLKSFQGKAGFCMNDAPCVMCV